PHRLGYIDDQAVRGVAGSLRDGGKTQQENQRQNYRNQGDEVQHRQATLANHHQHSYRDRSSAQDDHRLDLVGNRLPHHAPGRKQGAGYDDATQQGMQHQLAACDHAPAMQVVGGKHRCRGNCRQDVARQLGAGNAEKENRDNDPEQQEDIQPVLTLARRRWASFSSFVLFSEAAKPANGALHGLAQGRQREDDPRHNAQKKNRNVIPEGLRVLVQIGPKPLQVVLDEEDAKELRYLHLDGHEPG